MQESPPLSLPAEIRALILTYVITEEIPFDQPDISLCEVVDHRHMYEPACLFSPCLGLSPSCHSPYTLLFIDKQLREETLPRIKHICLDHPSSLSYLLPHLESFYKESPSAKLPFRLTIRNSSSTHLSFLEATLAECDRAPQNRDFLLRRLLDSACEWEIIQIANDHQLRPTFGNIDLNPNFQRISHAVEHVMLDGFLPFTLSLQPTFPCTGSTHASETANDQTNAASGAGDALGRLEVHAPYDTPWYDKGWQEQSR